MTISADRTEGPAAAPDGGEADGRAPHRHTHELVLLRSVMMGGEIAALGLAAGLLDLAIPLAAVVVVLGGQTLLSLPAWRGAREGRPMSSHELALQLCADIVLLTVVLYLAGGTTNPFADLYFVPLAFGAAALPWRHALAVAAAATAGHTLLGLAREIVDVPSAGVRQHLWQVGITLSDFLTAAMIAFVVFRVAARLRLHQRLLSREREQALNNRRLVELGAMATGAAHELGTPLSTMAVLCTELRCSYAHLPSLCDDLRIMSTQIEACKETLSRMLASTGQARAEGGGRVALDAFLDGLFARWQRLRPGVTVRLQRHGPNPAPQIVADLALEQAILNLLNNAADASPSGLDVDARWSGERLDLRIDDDGAGIDPHNLAQVGRPFFTTKQSGGGKGLGLFLTATTIERLGGRFTLGPRPEGGARAEVVLPLARISIPPLPESTP